jgi:hypothetical protein
MALSDSYFQASGFPRLSRRSHRSADFQVRRIAGLQTRKPDDIARPADLEIGDTSDIERGAEIHPRRRALSPDEFARLWKARRPLGEATAADVAATLKRLDAAQ